MIIRTFAALAAAFLAGVTASAGTFSFTGNLAHDNSLAPVAFHVGTGGVVDLTSLGFAGGIDARGQTIAAGGFDTVLSLYDSTGTGIAFNDDGATAKADATGHASDAGLSINLAPGTYTAYLTQYSNFGALLLTNGFAFDGVPDFAGGFIDSHGNQRDSHYALDIVGAGVVSAPEASSVAVLLAGLGVLGFAARRRRGA